MTVRTLTSLLLLAALVVPMGTGCRAITRKLSEKAAEKAIEESTGAKDVDLSSGGIKVQADNGEKIEIGGGAKMPDGWPDYAPQYPGSKITAALSSPSGKTATMESTDSPDKVIAFYKEKLTGGGFKQTVAGNFNGMQTLTMQKGNNKSNAVLTAQRQGDKTLISVSISER